MKKLFSIAIAAGFIAFAGSQAQAGQITDYSSTWKPGYSLDENGGYFKTTQTDADTSYNARVGVENKVETSSQAQAGFELDDASGQYLKTQVLKLDSYVSKSNELHSRNTWAPGYLTTDNKTYVKS